MYHRLCNKLVIYSPCSENIFCGNLSKIIYEKRGRFGYPSCFEFCSIGAEIIYEKYDRFKYPTRSENMFIVIL